MQDSVIAVAGHAARQSGRCKSFFVGAGLEKLRLKHVTGGANSRHRRGPWWSRTVVAVTGDTSGSAQVAAQCQGVMVNALVVFRELVGRDLVFLHPRLVRVTTSACTWDVDRVNGGPLVAGRTDIVHGMAIYTDGDFGVTTCQPFPVNTGVVLA